MAKSHQNRFKIERKNKIKEGDIIILNVNFNTKVIDITINGDFKGNTFENVVKNSCFF